MEDRKAFSKLISYGIIRDMEEEEFKCKLVEIGVKGLAQTLYGSTNATAKS